VLLRLGMVRNYLSKLISSLNEEKAALRGMKVSENQQRATYRSSSTLWCLWKPLGRVHGMTLIAGGHWSSHQEKQSFHPVLAEPRGRVGTCLGETAKLRGEEMVDEGS
jgi:hypothetical protein